METPQKVISLAILTEDYRIATGKIALDLEIDTNLLKEIETNLLYLKTKDYEQT